MNKTLTFSLIGIAAAALLTVGVFLIPKNESANAEKAMDRAEVESIVREFILANPEVIVESLNSFQQKQREDRLKQARDKLSQFEGDLVREDDPFIGPENASVTVVEFFDYNCGFCKRALPTIQQLADQDKDVKIVFKELPILSESSNTAAKAALAVHKISPEKYFEYHSKLMQFSGKKTEETLLKIAGDIGLDQDQVKETMKDPSISEHLEADKQVAQQIGITGTPSFVIGDQLIPGAVGLDTLKQKIAEERNGS